MQPECTQKQLDDGLYEQRHQDETKWIRTNAKRFAQQQGITEQEAESRLAQQAFRQVQFGAAGADDAQARSFLSQAKGLLPADPGCPSCGPGYMFYATPEQKANTGMYVGQVVSDAKALEFYGKNGIAQPTPQQVQASASKDASTRNTLSNAA
jgi:filamentous hemagglutinin